MTFDADENVIPDADLIIEKFGGIRPMATKLNVPVTTVQGWKKRNVIPGNRRNDIIRAAQENNINLGEFLIALTRRSGAPGLEDNTVPIPEGMAAPRVYPSETVIGASVSPRRMQNYAVGISAVALLGVAALAAFLFVVPKPTPEQEAKIAALQAEIARMKEEQQEVQAKTPEVQSQLSSMQSKMKELQDKAQGVSTVIQDLQSGNIQERLSSIESSVKGVIGQSNAAGLSGLLQRVTTLQQTPEGQAVLSSLVGSFASTASTAENQDEALNTLRDQNPALNEALQGVAPEDMKAAAMLIGFAQMRNALMRDNASFATDLELLRSVAAKDDPVLQASIDKLAPQAKTGVLTPTGLSKEFRGLAGDIVVSSLQGEDVSVQEKAKARLGDVFKVEKSGQQITGTETQIAVAEAQKRLDAGDVNGAVQILQGLEGPAAETAQPFLQQAQMTALAQQVQQALGHNVLGTLSQKQGSYTTGSGMGNVLNQVQQMIPGYGMTHDKESGFRMYRPVPLIPSMPGGLNIPQKLQQQFQGAPIPPPSAPPVTSPVVPNVSTTPQRQQ